MTPLFYSPEALDDVEDILTFLREQEEQNPELVPKFESDYRKAIQRIRDLPRAWPKVARGIRVKIVSKRFLYGIYYQYTKKTIIVAAVIHLSRNQSHWRRHFRK